MRDQLMESAPSDGSEAFSPANGRAVPSTAGRADQVEALVVMFPPYSRPHPVRNKALGQPLQPVAA